VIRRVPGLSESAARGGWASLYDVSPDWQPVIGEIAEHVFVDAGTSSHGFKLAPALGRHVADLVLGHGATEEAHRGCFVANSLRTDVVVSPTFERAA
jgi:glycine/D-amino acid oxidase-like deaminating enzyme